jgi:IS5 family transposase
MEAALIEVPTRRRLAGIDLISDRTPNKGTIPTFHHLLKKCEPAEQIFEVVKSC